MSVERVRGCTGDIGLDTLEEMNDPARSPSRPSRRRLSVVVVLLGLTFAVSAGVAFRIDQTGSIDTVNLVWNLFLAWIPFILALLVYDGARGSASVPMLVAGGALWLLFLPNAPYIVTDLKWLDEWNGGAPLLYDVALVTGAASIGLVLGFVSVYLVQHAVARTAGQLAGWFVALGALLLSGVGVYLGRVERWNSWDLFTRPSLLLDDVLAGLSDPLDYPRALALTCAVATLLTAGYMLFYAIFRRQLAALADG